jgi:hypothetical protein
LNIAPAHSRHWQIAVPQLLFLSLVGVWSLLHRENRDDAIHSWRPMWWCALYNTASLHDVCCVSQLAEKSSQRPGERRRGAARGLGVSERTQCCRERPIVRLRPRLPSYRKQMLNMAMPIVNCPHYRALYQGAAAAGALSGKRGGGHCTCVRLGSDGG